MDFKDFKKQYWYKTDLQQLCRKYHLPTYGTKAELENYITLYLKGTPANQIKPVRTAPKNINRLNSSQITTTTKLLNSGFSLNNEARKFFADYFAVDKFNFKKIMAIKMREVQKNQDPMATVQDLINLVNNPNSISSLITTEEKTYQWNNFVKDFHSDPQSNNFTQPLKVAAILWKITKNNEQSSKKYVPTMIKSNFIYIKKYLKKER